MARYLPMTKESLLNIKGVGERKYDQYGEAFLKVLQNWQEEHPNKKKERFPFPNPKQLYENKKNC